MKLRPSDVNRWSRCPGSVRLIESLPKSQLMRPAARDADRGTMAHSVLQQLVTFGEVFDGGQMSQEDIDLLMKHMLPLIEDADPMTVAVEKWIPLWYSTAEHPQGGTPDLVYRSRTDGMLTVPDLKWGAGVIVHEQSPQLAIYATSLSVFREPVRTIVVQPRRGEPVRSHVWQKDEQMRFRDEVLVWIDAVHAKDAPLIPGESQCQFCPAKAVCPELKRRAERAAEKALSTLPTDEDTSAYSDDLAIIESARAWCTAREAFIRQKMLGGTPVPDWKVVAGRRTRTWAADDAVIRQGLSLSGLRRSEYVREVVETLTPAQVEKNVGRARWRAIENPPEGEFALVKWAPGAPTIARSSDPRQAIAAGTNSLLSPVTMEGVDVDD